MGSFNQVWSKTGIGKRMTIAMLAILLFAISTTTGFVYNVFSSSYSEAVKERLVATGQAYTDSFLEWNVAGRMKSNT